MSGVWRNAVLSDNSAAPETVAVGGLAPPSIPGHQSPGNQRIDRCAAAEVGEVCCRERLGGILKSYHRAA